jgi:hypothetical protein
LALYPLLCGTPLPAATVLFAPFDSLSGWTVRCVGAGSAEIVESKDGRKSTRLTATQGTALLSRELPLEQVRGCRLTLSCSVENRLIVVGPQASSCGKLHLAVQTPGGTEHFSVHFTGTAASRSEGISADVPDNATRVVLNLGLEACSGTIRFEQLVVKNDQRGVFPIDLTNVLNADHGQLGLDVFPEGAVEWHGIPFQIVDALQSGGADCLRLRGLNHPDWPVRTSTPVRIGRGASAIYILHAALDGEEKRDSPAYIWTAHFAGGHTFSDSMFEGRKIGAVGDTKDLENWHVAWQQTSPDGRSVSFGVTKWPIPSDTPVESLSCRAYRGASPMVLAITVVEEPPAPAHEAPEFDEMGNPLDTYE